jgi:hypothetical protein
MKITDYTDSFSPSNNSITKRRKKRVPVPGESSFNIQLKSSHTAKEHQRLNSTVRREENRSTTPIISYSSSNNSNSSNCDEQRSVLEQQLSFGAENCYLDTVKANLERGHELSKHFAMESGFDVKIETCITIIPKATPPQTMDLTTYTLVTNTTLDA